MINLEKTKFFHIIYPPITGGNHLENLLSTNDQFEKKVSSENNTIIDLLNVYETKSRLLTKEVTNDLDIASDGFNVHVYETSTVFNTVYHNIENYLNYKKIFIVHSHSDIYEWHLHQPKMKNNFFKFLNKTKAIVISLPKDKNSRAYKRYEKYCLQKSQNLIFLSKPFENYVVPYKIAGFELFNESNSRLLDVDLFMSDNGWDYIFNFLKDNFNIVLTEDTKKLHELWIKMIDHSLMAK